MPVTGSSFTLDSYPQADGSRWCHETHETAGGRVVFQYLAAPDADAAAIMAARVAEVNEELAAQEAAAVVLRDGPLGLVHLTGAQFVQRFREFVRSADREEACRLAWWLLRRIAAGHITDAQARTAFGMTAAQWTTFKTNKLQPRADAWAAVLAATGE